MRTFSCMQISQFQYKWVLGFLRGCKTTNTRRQNHCNMLHDSTQVPHRKQVLIYQFSPPPPPLSPPPPQETRDSHEPFNFPPAPGKTQALV